MDITVLCLADRASNLRVGIGVPRGMHRTRCAPEVDNRKILAVVFTWWLNFGDFKFHDNESNRFGGIKGQAGFTGRWLGSGKVISKEIVKVCMPVSTVNMKHNR